MPSPLLPPNPEGSGGKAADRRNSAFKVMQKNANLEVKLSMTLRGS